MQIKKYILLVVSVFLLVNFAMAQQSFTLQSPDGKIKVSVDLKDKITYSIQHESDQLVSPSTLSLNLTTGEKLGTNPQLKKFSTKSINQTFETPFYKKRMVQDQYNELILAFKGDYSVIFRAYNDGAAYRFSTSKRKEFEVQGEEVSINFPTDENVYLPYVNKQNPASFEEQFWNSFENTYTYSPISKLDPKRLAFLPVVVEGKNGKKVCITEADLEGYPGMYLNNREGKNGFSAVFAPYPKKVEQGGHNKLQEIVKEREHYIAKVKGARNFPWRVIIVGAEDKDLVNNDMVMKLASPPRIKDVTWIKPGKVAWDWWNDWNIYGVNFKSGINNDTYKYYIDFASENKIGYVILDEGWAVNLQADLLQVIPEINLQELVDYGKQKNVGIILWAGYYAFNRDMENVCKHYSNMGVKGFKVDFMDRDDQKMVEFYYRAAEMASKYQLMLDFHGAFKPTGLQRTFPNVINFEGVHGLEQMKWSPPSVDQVTYDVTIPFIRMVAGPMDYTQGAMRNATKNNYRPVNSEPMSQGTRCRQLAEYIVFESPFNMLCDNPSNYRKEMECTQFIASVPTTWDNTISLEGKIGQYVAVARQKGSDWYIGAMTNWEERELEFDLKFLPEGNYKVEIFKDGINADKAASDYSHETIELSKERKIKISMAPGGGYVARIFKE